MDAPPKKFDRVGLEKAIKEFVEYNPYNVKNLLQVNEPGSEKATTHDISDLHHLSAPHN